MNHWRDPRDGVPEAQTKGPDFVNQPSSRRLQKRGQKAPFDVQGGSNLSSEYVYVCAHHRRFAGQLELSGSRLQKKILPNTSRILVPSVCSAGVASRMGVRVCVVLI